MKQSGRLSWFSGLSGLSSRLPYVAKGSRFDSHEGKKIKKDFSVGGSK